VRRAQAQLAIDGNTAGAFARQPWRTRLLPPGFVERAGHGVLIISRYPADMGRAERARILSQGAADSAEVMSGLGFPDPREPVRYSFYQEGTVPGPNGPHTVNEFHPTALPTHLNLFSQAHAEAGTIEVTTKALEALLAPGSNKTS